MSGFFNKLTAVLGPAAENFKKQTKKGLLMQHGLPEVTATYILLNELTNWSTLEIMAFFTQIGRPYSPTPLGVPTVQMQQVLQNNVGPAPVYTAAPPLPPRPQSFLKAEIGAVQSAAEQQKALCINARGEWSIRDTGYVAISHVWSEGIQSDADNRGFSLQHLQLIMSKLRGIVLPNGSPVEWVWLDVYAIPAGGHTGSTQEEILKTDVINSLANVYRNADGVVVLDALVLQLRARNVVDVAIGLVCGNWMRRVWTYQEIKLAREAYIITANSVCSFNALVQTLITLKSQDSAKYSELALTFMRIQRRDDVGISLADIALSCQDRHTTNDEDHARAFFPVLDLKWTPGWTKVDGMKHIWEESRDARRQGPRLIAMHGAPRMPVYPAWAPASLTGLEGMVMGGMKYLRRGVAGEWYAAQVVGLTEYGEVKGKQAIDFQIRADPAPVVQTARCILSKGEVTERIKYFKSGIADGTAIILRSDPFNPVVGVAKIVLLCKRQPDKPTLEAVVCLSAALNAMSAPLATPRQSWLLLHFSQLAAVGECVNSCLFTMSHYSSSTPLHEAAHTGDLSTVRTILVSQPNLVNTLDSKQRTPLHRAALTHNPDIVALLLTHNTNHTLQDQDGYTALHFACSVGDSESTAHLLPLTPPIPANNLWLPMHEAIVNNHPHLLPLLVAYGHLIEPPTEPDNWSPLLLAGAAKTTEAASFLLNAGANPNRIIGDRSPLYIAAGSGTTETVRLLLQHGADINHRTASGRTPLSAAFTANRFNKDTAMLLINAGVDVCMPQGGWPPLCNAALVGDVEVVKAILEKGADVRARSPEGWTPLHLAARKGHRSVLRVFMDAGAEAEARDADGKTPLMLAVEEGRESCVLRLRELAGARF